MTSQEIRTLTDQYMMHPYGRFPVAIDHREIWDMAISPG